MTKNEAWTKAHALWMNSARYGAVVVRHKKNSPRFLVGHQKRCAMNEKPVPMVVMGASDVSLDDAFANVAKCPCEGDYCTNPTCDMPDCQYDANGVFQVTARASKTGGAL
jgi:hypothetical protein